MNMLGMRETLHIHTPHPPPRGSCQPAHPVVLSDDGNAFYLSDTEATGHTWPMRTLNTAGVAKDWRVDSCFIYFTETRLDRQGEGLPLGTAQGWMLPGKVRGGLLRAGLGLPVLLRQCAHTKLVQPGGCRTCRQLSGPLLLQSDSWLVNAHALGLGVHVIPKCST